MRKIIKFSKTSAAISKIKNNYYANNDKLLKNELIINKRYIKQPLRKKCKNCNFKASKKLFSNFSVDYFVCSRCSHLNGIYADSVNFCDWLYSEKKTDNYSNKDFHMLKDFDLKVNKIYLPKAKFLQQVLKKNFNVIDVGAGAGHFVKALERLKINCTGYEPSKYLVKIGNKKIKKNKLINLSLEEMQNVFSINEDTLSKKEKKIKQKVVKPKVKNSINVLSLIGVLEHLQNIESLMTKFTESKINYLYISVPIFSLSVFIENVFHKVFPRQLVGGHTHLYTKESLNFFAKKWNLEIVGEWWFGQDFLDMYRSILLSQKSYNKKKFTQFLDKNLFNYIDKLQNVLDKNMACSEAHIIFLKKNN